MQLHVSGKALASFKVLLLQPLPALVQAGLRSRFLDDFALDDLVNHRPQCLECEAHRVLSSFARPSTALKLFELCFKRSKNSCAYGRY